MSGLGLILSVCSLLIALMALWKAWQLRRDVSEIKRETYYLVQKLKSVSPQIEATMEPLRIQTALLALGKPVSDRLIRTGRLYHEISAKEAGEFFSVGSPKSQVLWLDVRTHSEYTKQHIPGAQLIPVEDLERKIQTDIPSTSQKIIVYCSGGDRSRLACDFLSRHDFGHVYLMKDGLNAWSGPLEGAETPGLIQIASKTKKISQMGRTISTSARTS